MEQNLTQTFAKALEKLTLDNQTAGQTTFDDLAKKNREVFDDLTEKLSTQQAGMRLVLLSLARNQVQLIAGEVLKVIAEQYAMKPQNMRISQIFDNVSPDTLKKGGKIHSMTDIEYRAYTNMVISYRNESAQFYMLPRLDHRVSDAYKSILALEELREEIPEACNIIEKYPEYKIAFRIVFEGLYLRHLPKEASAPSAYHVA